MQRWRLPSAPRSTTLTPVLSREPRLTRMPTVQVDVGYLTNLRDRELLVSGQIRDAIAEGILAAVKRLYLLGKNDRPTGTFTFAELLAHERTVEAGRAGHA